MKDSDLIRKLILATSSAIETHADELTTLDQAIGDGDHGINLKRGFNAVSGQMEELAELELPAALRKAGMTLVMKVGGASGPLFGSALMEMGKSTQATPASHDETAAMISAAVNAVKARGKSDIGAKTMLDVMVPVRDAVAAALSLDQIRKAADEAAEQTREMRATKGRAAFLGERSIGHIDPGARSAALLVHVVCDVLERK